MSDISQGNAFPQAEIEEWRKLVDKTLGGADFDKKLVTTTYDNIPIQPLYTRADASEPGELPGVAPFTRGTDATPKELPWHIAQSFSQPNPIAANKNILHELSLGVTAITLKLDDDARGERTIAVSDLDDMKELLSGVHMHMVPVHLEAGDRALPAASLLMACAQQKDEDLSQLDLKLGVDPLGELARRGALSETMETSFALLSDCAGYVARNLPKARTVMCDTRPYHSAGASPAQEIAIALATGREYLAAMENNGLALEKAAEQIYFQVTTDSDFFGSIAKLRAFRRLWAMLTTACKIEAKPACLLVETAARMMSARDPGVNMLRTTVACFAAGAAGANSVSVEPYTTKHGMPDEQARRIARNTQIILQEEAGIAKVLDPAGGSYFIENLTNELCEKAWDIFQEIEAGGGMFASLRSGKVQEMIASLHENRRRDIARRKLPITGVSEFPDIHEGDVATAELSTAPQDQTGSPKGPLALPTPPDGTFAAMIEAAKDGAGMTDLAGTFAAGGESCAALPVISLAEDFENLRAASDGYLEKHGTRPQIFLCNLGKVSAFTTRATYAKNFFEAGGIEAISSEGQASAQEAATAFKNSGAEICILCSSDAVYADLAIDTAKEIAGEGAKAVYLAGHPGENKSAYLDAGISSFIFMGCDVLELLQEAHDILGVGK